MKRPKVTVRRYNFIYDHRCVYSGLFHLIGFFGFLTIRFELINKRHEIAHKYGVKEKEILISNTIKD